LRQILLTHDDLDSACSELKRRCFERGAEDNLTAVIIRLGEATKHDIDFLAERTLPLETPRISQSAAGVFAGNLDRTEESVLLPPSRIAFPANNSQTTSTSNPQFKPAEIPAARANRGSPGRSLVRFFVFLFFLAAVAAAFYGGTRYGGPLPFGLRKQPEIAAVTLPTPTPEDSWVVFEKARREADRSPAEWLSSTLQKEMARQSLINPLESTEPQFLYLYGRSLLLAGSYDEASKALEQAIARCDQAPSPDNAALRKEAVLALAAATLKSNKGAQRALTHMDELRQEQSTLRASPTPMKSP